MTPADFSVSVNPGSLAPYCAIGTLFGYSGRELGWQLVPELDVEARNARGATTVNYTLGNFNKLSASSLTRTAPVADLAALNAAGIPFPVNSALNPGSLTVTAPGRQRYQFASNDAFTFQKTVDSRVAPFIPQLAINLTSLIDADTISASALPSDVTPLANFDLRYGRIRLENAYGPETRDLIVPMRAEYYDGSQMVVNDAESCWIYRETDATLSPTITSMVPVTDNLSAGVTKPGSELTLEAPGAGNTGSTRLNLAVPLWLQDDFNGDDSLTSPEATATFGVYRGHDRIIYWREVEP
jgi:MSHA biogenesis protein MshQ